MFYKTLNHSKQFNPPKNNLTPEEKTALGEQDA